MTPTADNVAALLGRPVTTEQATAALTVVTALVKSYCRHDWDELPDDITAVVLTATLRLLANPEQLSMAQGMAAFTVDYREGFTGWSLTELSVLNRYRRRAK